MLRRALLVSLVSSAGLASLAWTQEPLGTFSGPRTAARWMGGMGVPGIGLSGGILAWATFDDGSGPAVYAAGWFYAADDRPANGVARWNGTAWEPVGQGIRLTFAQEIRALAVYDDGSGPALYAAGQFDRIGGQPAGGFARWDGESWEVLPGQVGFGFHTLVVGDTGEGPSLFAGGDFIRVGGVRADNVARWDGAWRPIGAGIPLRTCYALEFYDDGTGEALYAGMEFTPGESSLRRWSGTTWDQVAGAPATQLNALQTFDDGSGARLGMGGFFAGGSSSVVHAYDGTSFTALGTLSQAVEDLDVLPGPGSTDLLVAGGSLFTLGHVATWDGAAWQSLGAGLESSVDALAVLDVGTGPRVHADGGITPPGATRRAVPGVWDGTQWTALAGDQIGMDSSVVGFFEHDDGTGTSFHAHGAFENNGLTTAHALAEWNGSSWDEVGGGLHWNPGTINAVVSDVTTFQTGDGPVLVAVGTFSHAGATPAWNVARWNGVDWAALGPGINAGAGRVGAVETYQSLLYVGGTFGATPGQPGARITAWNGVTQTWSALPGDLTTTVPTSQAGVRDLARFDDGGGELLYVGGDVDFAGGILVENLARWDGTGWSAVPQGGLTVDDQVTNAEVTELVPVDVPSVGGPALVVRGTFDFAGTLPVQGLAWLDGSGWNAPGTFSRSTIQTVGQVGQHLYAIDRLDGVVRWNGLDWVPLGGGALGTRPGTAFGAFGNALFGHDDGSGALLFVGGTFDTAGPYVSTNIARFDLGGRPARAQPRGL